MDSHLFIDKVAVIGAGTMGREIALVAALGGHDVVLIDADVKQLASSTTHIEKAFSRRTQNKDDTHLVDATFKDRLLLSSQIQEVTGCSLVIEAINEDLNAKADLLQRVDLLIGSDVLVATNTSSISITKLAKHISNPERFIGLHFFNPATRMKLVEIVVSPLSSKESISRAKDLVISCAKMPVVTDSRPGFIVNRLARPIYSESLLSAEIELASIETLDLLTKSSAQFPMGPFSLMDLIGLDVNFAVTSSVFEQTFFDERYRPSNLQDELVSAGLLGRKRGRGFYDYKTPSSVKVSPIKSLFLEKETEALVVGGSLLDDLFQQLPKTNPKLSVRETIKDESYPSWRGLLFKDTLLCSLDGLSATEVSESVGVKGVVGIDLAFDYSNCASLGVSLSLGCNKTIVEEIAGLFENSGVGLYELKDIRGQYITRMTCSLVNEFADFVLRSNESPDTLDKAFKLGLNQRISPLDWLKKLGPTYFMDVCTRLYEAFGSARYHPSLQLKMWSDKERLGSSIEDFN